MGVVRLSTGDIVIAESTTGELRRYDQSGALVWRAGGQGQGPGEHKYLGFLRSLPGDSLVTADSDRLRLNVFGPDGKVLRTIRLEMPEPGLVPRGFVGVSERDLVMTFEDRREEPARPGVGRWPGLRIAMLSLDDGRIRTWIDVPGSESLVFGKGPEYPVSGGSLALVDTEQFSVRFIDLDGRSTQRILRRDEPARQVTSDHVEAWVEWAISVTRDPQGTDPVIRAARETPMASTLPVLESLYLDAVGNLWVEPYSVFGTPMPPFQVYTPDGSWLGSVAVPPGLGTERRLRFGFGRTCEIGNDYILGVWHDELGVEHVRLYGLEKAGGWARATARPGRWTGGLQVSSSSRLRGRVVRPHHCRCSQLRQRHSQKRMGCTRHLFVPVEFPWRLAKPSRADPTSLRPTDRSTPSRRRHPCRNPRR
ncbi:MAG: hypothetical protein F4107_03235 [Gemmatimonadetes bacterium]|nr:hypothetical protein [Gemmatimonadota bacterium]MYD12257.1 hypothetical protein [Gemmatimonadota bacterium]MYI64939.1 hypothetical protein [Gemmatimonadota bacterium]